MTMTALRAAAMFDGDRFTTDPTVLLDGTTIVAAGPGVPVPDGVPVIDAPGATILPGLVDGHVHLSFDASPDPVAGLAAMDDDALSAAIVDAARRAARCGVTTMRDLGDRGYLTLGLRASTDPTLPHVVVAGVPITPPGGHCHFLGESPAGVRAAVRERAERGVDVIKIMASGGQMTPTTKSHEAQYTEDDLRAAVDEAHRHGRPIVAHAHGTPAVIAAVAAGVDGIEHVSFMTADGVDEIPDDLLAAFGRGEMVLGLTFGMREVAGFPPPPAILARMPKLIANGRRLHAAGARIIVGSDAGIGPSKPVDAIRWSLPQLAAVGMTPAEALHAITARAATALGLGDRKGRLAAGYDADVLVVNGDPRVDPAAIHDIHAVYVRGTRLV